MIAPINRAALAVCVFLGVLAGGILLFVLIVQDSEPTPYASVPAFAERINEKEWDEAYRYIDESCYETAEDMARDFAEIGKLETPREIETFKNDEGERAVVQTETGFSVFQWSEVEGVWQWACD